MTNEEIEKRLAEASAAIECGCACGYQAEQLADIIRRLMKGREWRPIETAPKDITLWGFWEGEYGYFQGPITWGYCPYKNTSCWLDGYEDGNSILGELTHWMPLPLPPKGYEQ